jgi:hypothetical protein
MVAVLLIGFHALHSDATGTPKEIKKLKTNVDITTSIESQSQKVRASNEC